jgi:hypothetical protein
MEWSELTTLVKGQKYKVRHRIMGVQRRDRESVMTYLGIDRTFTETQWNARPAAGTESLRPQNILAFTPVASHVEHYVNHLVR